MATVVEKKKRIRVFGFHSAGTLMSTREFDRARFEDNSRYELIHGVLIVTPPPLESSRDPNGELEYWLRSYRDNHPQGAALDGTLAEQTVRTKKHRRCADRVIWTGLGRMPRRRDKPPIVAEFVSEGKRDRERDYEEKRDEYMEINVKEYWIIDRFQRTLTVYRKQGAKVKKLVFTEKQVYTTPLLPGFELPLAKLFAIADRWSEQQAEDPAAD